MMNRHPWIVAFMSHVSALGTESDLDSVYFTAARLYPEARLLDPVEVAESEFGRLAEDEKLADR